MGLDNHSDNTGLTTDVAKVDELTTPSVSPVIKDTSGFQATVIPEVVDSVEATEKLDEVEDNVSEGGDGSSDDEDTVACSDESEDEDEEMIDPSKLANDEIGRLLSELCVLFRQKNGREPTDMEFKQWISVLNDAAISTK